VVRFLDSATATNDSTVTLKFKVPAPRFWEFITYKFDIGVYIVPKQNFSGQDWAAFKHLDTAKDWPTTTGPWKVVPRRARAEGHGPPRLVVGRRGRIQKLPRVERIILLPVIGEHSRPPRRSSRTSSTGPTASSRPACRPC
jgi:hypothetical protein